MIYKTKSDVERVISLGKPASVIQKFQESYLTGLQYNVWLGGHKDAYELLYPKQELIPAVGVEGESDYVPEHYEDIAYDPPAPTFEEYMDEETVDYTVPAVGVEGDIDYRPAYDVMKKVRVFTLSTPAASPVEELALMKVLGERAIEQHIQAVVDAYNSAHSLSFRDVYSCDIYKDHADYPHNQFCKDITDWNWRVWDAARTILTGIATGQRSAPSLEDFILELPVYVGVV